MKQKDLVEAYKLLGEASIKSLEDKDGVIIIKNRMVMRSYADACDAMVKDAKEKFEPEGIEAMQEKLQNWDKLSVPERKEVDNFYRAYQEKIDAVCGPELDKEIDCPIEKISVDAGMKLLKENGWPISRLDTIAFMVG